MHSFHQTRGRVYFDIFCALTIAASCGVAWIQTGASALLAIAGVVCLYSVVHATDVPPKRAAIAADVPAEPVAEQLDEHLLFDPPVEVWPVSEAQPKAEKPKRRSRKKQPAVEIVAIAEPEVTEAAEQAAEPFEPDEFHAHIEPLFEAQPLVRQQRAVFGRKAG